MVGKGKYDGLATFARLTTGASAVVLIVIDGKQGDGVSVQADLAELGPRELARRIRLVADGLDEDGGN